MGRKIEVTPQERARNEAATEAFNAKCETARSIFQAENGRIYEKYNSGEIADPEKSTRHSDYENARQAYVRAIKAARLAYASAILAKA